MFASEAESFSSVAEQRARRRLIEAQSAAIAGAMASICNDEQASYGVMSGHDRKTLSLSEARVEAARVKDAGRIELAFEFLLNVQRGRAQRMKHTVRLGRVARRAKHGGVAASLGRGRADRDALAGRLQEA